MPTQCGEKAVKSKGDADEEFKLDYITAGGIGIPEVAILEAKKRELEPPPPPEPYYWDDAGAITYKDIGVLRKMVWSLWRGGGKLISLFSNDT